MATEIQIKKWIINAVQKENLKSVTIQIETKIREKTGFVGDLIYAKVRGKHPKTQETVQINLISKHLNRNCGNGAFAKKEMFDCEIFMYTEVFPVFEEFQRDKNVIDCFKNYPKCFYSNLSSSDFVVLENLNYENYKLWPREEPVSLEHTSLVFEKYGKFHAISFALKEQKPQIFEKIGRKCRKSTFSMFLEKTNAPKAMAENLESVANLLKYKFKLDELEKIKNLSGKVRYILTEMYLEDPDFAVISHGDCWNNNYLYKYQEENSSEKTKNLVDVKILDWQCSVLSSPIFDLSYFFYTTSGKQQYENHEKLLKLYYKSLSNFLSTLGSNPENCYPYEKFIQQWNKFSVYGFVIATVFIKMVWMGNEEDLPKYDELSENDPNRDQVFNTKINDFSRYKKCMFDLFEHFLRGNTE